MGSWLFGKQGSVNKPDPPATGLRIQSAVYGRPIAIGWGMTRVAGNIIDYVDFRATPASAPSSGSPGKGTGSGTGSGKGSTGNTGQYEYSASYILGLCEGPIAGIGTVWNNQSIMAVPTTVGSGLGFNLELAQQLLINTSNRLNYMGAYFGTTVETGSYAQTAWAYMQSLHPDHALNYRGLASINFSGMTLGNSPELPNITLEVKFQINGAFPGTNDANIADIIPDFATNVHYGVKFPSAKLADMASARGYTNSVGLALSPCLQDQRPANSFLQELLQAANCDFSWNGQALSVVPYGDTAVQQGATLSIAEQHTIPSVPVPSIGVTFHAQFIENVSVFYVSFLGGAQLTRVAAPPLGFGGFGAPPVTIEQYYIVPGTNTYVFNPLDAGHDIIITYKYAAIASYSPPSAPLYDLTDDDFVTENQGEAPIAANIKSVWEQYNSINVEYLAAINSYNPAVVNSKDDAQIAVHGINTKPTVQIHYFTQAGSAKMCADLLLGREWIRRTFKFTVLGKFILLDPMDIVTVTDSALGLFRQWVRIIEITENAKNGTLTITAEEYLNGTGAAPVYGVEAVAGGQPNYNMPSDGTASTVIFEPTDELAGGLEIWAAACGLNPTLWGGYDLWVSFDNETYSFVGTQLGPSRMGVLTGSLGNFAPPAQGPSIDNGHTLSVDLTVSRGQLSSGSQADMLGFSTLLYVDGEFISYQNSTPTGTYAFNLAPLNRGGYGSTISSHASGTSAVRIDAGVLKVPYTQDRIGSTIYLKFLSFNNFGGGKQQLTDVGPAAYVIKGTALTSPLPNVTNFVFSYVGNITYFDWDQITDFRHPISYEIRKGDTWDGAQVFGEYLHPHVPALGDGIYWIKAKATPVAGLIVYSEDPTPISINGSVIPINLLASYDEGPTGGQWPGTLTGNVANDGTFIHTTLVTVSPYTDFLAIPDVLDGSITDKFAVGNTGSGYYTPPDSHTINMGRLAPCLVQIIFNTAAAGTSDFFHPGPPDDNDVFAHSDIFDSASNKFIDAHPEISISTDGVAFGPWQRYAAGFYNIWKIKTRMFLNSLDPTNVEVFLTQYKVQVYAPTRVDHPLVNTVVGPGVTPVTFAPDGSSFAAFNAGPNGGFISGGLGILLPAASLPGTQVTVINGQPGDDVIITGLSLSGCTVQPKNGATAVQRNITLQVTGY